MYIKDLSLHEGKRVTLKGWVANKRESKGLVFIIIRDGSGLCQSVVDATQVSEDIFTQAGKLTLERALKLMALIHNKSEKHIENVENDENEKKMTKMKEMTKIKNVKKMAKMKSMKTLIK
jgi:aspartyl/asparaginyl-tRNA synthetase